MNLTHLREFNTLADSVSFREAAAKLGVSPALLSEHIAALEKKLGVALLTRDAHRCELTAAGKRFLPAARDISDSCAALRKRVGEADDVSAQSLKIAMSGPTMPARLGPYLDEVNRLQPSLRLGLLDDSKHSIESLKTGEIDLFFTYCPEAAEYGGIEKALVYRTHLLVLVPGGHRLARKSSVSLRELDGETLIHYPATAETAMRDCETELLHRYGIRYSVYDEPASPSKYFVLVPVGKGIALCPWYMRDSIPPNTVALKVSDADASVAMYMFYIKGNGNPAFADFISGFLSFEAAGNR